jgi:hypothetical protein
MRTCLDRKAPPSSADIDLINKLKPTHELYYKSIDKKVLYAIDWAMKSDPLKRPQTMGDFLNAINYL